MSGRIAYFHGLPGGPGEWTCFAPAALRGAAIVPDRNPGCDPGDLAAALDGDDWILVGFSLGAPLALRIAAALGRRASQVHLISPAAPLQLGDFLPAMAGGALFRLAAARPRLFALVARAESILARIAPRWLLGRLMAGAAGADRALAADPAFVAAMSAVLRGGLGRSADGFIAEVSAYVGDWRAVLEGATAPVTIWQGDVDTWTPPAMARALQAALPGGAVLHIVPGASHYSTLREALVRIGQTNERPGPCGPGRSPPLPLSLG